MPSPRDSSAASIVRQVRAKGIRDRRVLEALGKVPRPRFVPPDTRKLACEDRAVEIGLDQTISQPFMVAVMTLELGLTGSESVLEIGTGSGYQTAVLAHLAREVFTVERHGELSLRARGVLDGLGLENIHYRIGDGTLGWTEMAPFDRILITAGAPELPTSLFQQLNEGGILVAPLGDDRLQQLTVVRKIGGIAKLRTVLPCHFVKLIGQEGWGEEGGGDSG
ncbi:protein-L-isoaspartate(D-aspartate) O-methyltransferase [Tundrisphaera lichenicola]|uniref:protein-L-isoaspartate(D-aspartate) O-methyltransferase n=1 Tax=Tundrisphaera lichenicola TaxID=2029860 RepID=UPI003EBDDBFF